MARSKKTDAQKTREARPLSEADRIFIESVRTAEARIRAQEGVVADLRRKCSAATRELRGRERELRNIVAERESLFDANPDSPAVPQ